MRKLLAICAAVALFSGDCVWGIENEDTQNLLQQTDSTGKKSRIRGTISKGVQKLKKLNPFKHKRYEQQIFNNSESKQEEESETTTDYIWKVLNELQAQITANSQRLDNIQTQITQLQQANSQTNSQKSEDAKPKDLYKFVGNRLYYYKKEYESKGYKEFATPTTVSSATDNWNDISEIRYANDVSYDKLENPKVILYRNKDNSCYIILRIVGNKLGIFYGVNKNNVEIDEDSFSVYDVSQDVGSFTDKISRRIYVDKSGLYFVSADENSLEDVINAYQSEGKFDFKGSVIKVSAIDGTITWNGKPVTEDNFFDNWVLEEIETERQIAQRGGKTVTEKVKKTKQVLSTKQPGKKEILRNFYPPKGEYEILKGKYENIYLNAFSETPMLIVDRSTLLNFTSTKWLNFFIINKVFSPTKADDKKVAEQLVRNGIFALISPTSKYYIFTQRMYNKVEAWKGYIGSSFQETIRNNPALFRNLDFVRSLKPEFSELDKDYESAKGSGLLLMFEIVRNL